MPYNPDLHHRRSIRYTGYDYSQPGYYFVTLLTYQRECLFGQIADDEMQLTLAGRCAQVGLITLPDSFPILVDTWVIMPDHLHAIIAILEIGSSLSERKKTEKQSASFVPVSPGAAGSRPHGTSSGSLGAILQNYKSLTARRINIIRNTPGAPVWHRNYYERIIRNEQELNLVRRYIMDNPINWGKDEEEPF